MCSPKIRRIITMREAITEHKYLGTTVKYLGTTVKYLGTTVKYMGTTVKNKLKSLQITITL